MEKDSNTLNVSFPKDTFLEEEFNIDKFLQENCANVGLKKLLEDLGLYLKHLQSVMIDIVNSESNAIINLSSELKILPSKFINLSVPIEKFRKKIMVVDKSIEIHLNNLKRLMQVKDSMMMMKSLKRNELRILLSSYKINHILKSHIGDNSVNMEILERSVDQYVLLQMYSQHCCSEEFRREIVDSTDILIELLNNVFYTFLQNEDSENTVRCLQMYMIMNTQNTAEQLYRQKIVRPALLKIINEEYLKSCDGDLNQLYCKIIEFAETDMNHILTVLNKLQGITYFNFILNSFWVEVDEQLKLNLSSIYAPGNPSVFHKRFRQTCQFLDKMEGLCPDVIQQEMLVENPVFASHKSQWNLPVYYEIRHLEIVQKLEQNLPTHVSTALFCKENNEFRLEPCQIMWESMQCCFSRDIYIMQLLDKFWKLNLQILSRLNTWVRSLLKTNVPFVDEIQSSDVGNPSALMDMKNSFLVNLHVDLVTFINKLKNVFESNLFLDTLISEHLRELFIKCLEEPQVYLKEDLNMIEDFIIDILYLESSTHVKQISQIPRLFRKTNRSVPIIPSRYLSLISKPAENFYITFSNILDDKIAKRIVSATHKRIITEYIGLVENVLISVAKTEKSLRRLKKIKISSDIADVNAITDDQKIRLQVQIDVTHYIEEARKYIKKTDIDPLLLLIKETGGSGDQ